MSLKRILIAGEGGQGIQTLANLLTLTSYGQKKKVTYLPNFGVEQRGGVSLAFLQISNDEISFPKFHQADIVILFAPRAVQRIEQYLKNDSLLIFDNNLIPEKSVNNPKIDKMAIPASHLAKEKLIPKVFNIIMFGVLTFELKLKPDKTEKVIENYFYEKYKKEPELRHFNKKAFKLGYDLAREVTKK